jgi:hypothetical protein
VTDAAVRDTTGYAVAVLIDGVAIAPDLVVADVTIRSGRTRQDDGIEPATATIELLEHDTGSITIGIAQRLQVTIDAGLGPKPRFTGRITEITRTPIATEDGSSWTIVGAGQTSRLARFLLTPPLPAESAAARAQRVISAVGFTAVIAGGAGLTLAAYGLAGDAPVATDQILADLITDTGAIVADLGDGSILVQFGDGRLSEDKWTPDPALTFTELAFAQSDDVINDVQVSWTAGIVSATSPGSIQKYDRRSVSLATSLADVGSATTRAANIIGRLAIPAWAIDALTTYDRDFLNHGYGAVVNVAPLPPGSPVESPWQGVLEGWTEHYQPSEDGSQRVLAVFAVALGDLQHSAETVHWGGVTPTLKWNQVDPQTDWTEAVSNAALTP